MKEPPTRSARNAAHVSTACDACRKRKVKCDGMQPICTPCARSSAQDQCTWTRKDGRKKTTRDDEREQLALVLNENSRLKAELMRLRKAQGIQPAHAGELPLPIGPGISAAQDPETTNALLDTIYDASSDPLQAGGDRPPACPYESAASGPGSHSLTGTYDIDNHFAADPPLGFNFGANFGGALSLASIECPAPALPWTVMADPNLPSTLNTITADEVQGGPHLDLPYLWDTGAETL